MSVHGTLLNTLQHKSTHSGSMQDGDLVGELIEDIRARYSEGGFLIILEDVCEGDSIGFALASKLLCQQTGASSCLVTSRTNFDIPGHELNRVELTHESVRSCGVRMLASYAANDPSIDSLPPSLEVCAVAQTM